MYLILKGDKMKISNCCEAPFHEPGYPDNDICSKCLEHAEPIDEDTMQEDEILMYETEHEFRPREKKIKEK
jgi:hypothetical protein